MGDYLLVGCTERSEAAMTLSSELRQRAQHAGDRICDLNAHAWLAVRGPHPPKTLQVGAWTLVGDVFNRQSPDLPWTAPDDPWSFERKMTARFWGRFIGVRFSGDQVSALFRDPSGAMECVAWTQEGLTLVCSSAPDWLLERVRPPWRINVRRLAQALHDPVATTGSLFIDGPVALEPGVVQPLPLDEPPEAVWRPAAFARRSLDSPPPIEEAASDVRAAIDEAVSGLAGASGPIAAEVSGGLDSSVVAASLVHCAPGAVQLWLNLYGTTPESDERVYVAALARTLDIAPTSVPHAAGVLSETGLNAISQGFRPGLNALDRPHTMDWARRATAAGVTAVMTGKGGDSILLQRATADIFDDLWHAYGWRALLAPDVLELAAANEISIWSMIQQARRRAREPYHPPARSHPLLSPLSSPPVLHPWLTGCEDFGPAKAFQIAGVADNVSRHGPSALTDAVDVRHPLCAQPVIEACLALPTPLLTIGGRDRGLVRHAFRDRLPVEILERRSKGDMTRIYGRMILESLDVLRPWLINGRLAALGLIDRKAAETELDRDTLVWRGRFSTIMVAAAFEGWLRAWERRLGPAG